VIDTRELNIDPSGGRRILAALCHFAGVVPVYGMLVPAAVWLANRRCDWPVAFQALQALIAQAAFHVLLLVPLAGWLVAALLDLLDAPMAGFLFTLNWWFTGLLFIIAWVAFLFATFQTYQSGRFLYPILGRRLVQRGAAPAGTEV
jgi:uncharacterized Tic20 family protein